MIYFLLTLHGILSPVTGCMVGFERMRVKQAFQVSKSHERKSLTVRQSPIVNHDHKAAVYECIFLRRSFI